MARIFISYKRVDKEKVFDLKNQIEASTGEKCWIDLDGIASDAQFVNVIIDAINNCEIFLFMYSSSYSSIVDYKNEWTIRELDFAQHKRKRIVFINLDSSDLTDWFYMLFGTMQQVDATNPLSINKFMQDIRGWLNKVQWVDAVDDSKFTEMRPQNIPMCHMPRRHKIFKIGGESFKMIRVQKGSFIMGETSILDSLSISDLSYPHEVNISKDYYIGEIPVTQALWYCIMGKQPSRFYYDDKAPVDSVSWDDCMEFIMRLNLALGVEFRLPTEAEWEYAAKGGNLSKHYIYSGSNNIDDVAWNRNNSDGMTHAVAQKAPNEIGLFDMSGNVWEWCSDIYSDLDESRTVDPVGPPLGNQHVYRGGCWCEIEDCCIISRRSGLLTLKVMEGWG